MSLFSFFRKNKQESASDDSAFFSRAEEESKAVRRRRSRAEQAGPAGDPKDPILPEKKRARRRLIGAVALVLAAVIGLPMILDSQPKPVADDIAIQIPSKDKQVPLPRSHTPANDSATASLDATEEMLDPADLPDRLDDKQAPQKAANQAEPASQAPSQAKTVESPKVVGKSAEADPVAKHEIKTGTKPDPKASDKKAGKYAIQVAALATKEKIDELQGKLKSGGIKSYTQKVATAAGDRTRIRVGPFDSKEEAEKVRAKIIKLGLNGALVPV